MDNQKKDSNPKDALGVKKVPLHAVPVKPLLEVGLAMMEGGRKYGTHNYRVIGVRMSTYYNAAMRHLMAWWEGEEIDPDSGVPHLVKAMASIFVVRDGILMGNCVDDRPIQYPDGIDMNRYNNLAAGMIKKYPECAKPFTMHSDIKAAGLKSTGCNNCLLTTDRPPHCSVNCMAAIHTEPQFKAGDKVRIKLREGTGQTVHRLCKEAGYAGIYERKSGDNGHIVNIAGLGETPFFYTEELTLIEGD